MPTPIPAPVAPTNYPVSGGTYTTGSGFTQVSGPGLEYAEYRQTLSIEYTRNPRATHAVANVPYWSLSQLSSNELKNVFATSFHTKITTNNSCTKITSNYSLSSSYQPQKFQLDANKFDKMGISYGEVAGSSNSYVFGPAGQLVTSQPHVRRVPWVDGTDVEYSYVTVGTNMANLVSGELDLAANHTGAGNTVWGQSDIVAPYSDYVHGNMGLDSETSHPQLNRYASGWPYTIHGGAYNTSSENGFGDNVAGLTTLIGFIESNCAFLKDVSSGNWFERFIKLQPQVSNGWNYPQEADRLPVNPYYSTSFHDYT
jgi:hypothetical protein